jgi:hypothetical protein
VPKNFKESKKLIAAYLDQRVTAKLDGALFDHVPGTFRFRFQDPEELADELSANYSDELGEMEALDDDGDWNHPHLVPVASVSTVSDDADEQEDDDDELYEFAWIFLDWSAKQPPSVLVTTSDDWGDERKVKNLAALQLALG